MTIEFVFNDIKDKTMLYKVEQYEQISRFTGELETVENIEYVGGDYCKAAIDLVAGKIAGIKSCEYKGATERMANETFLITTDLFVYTVTCTVNTYKNSQTGLKIKIASESALREEENKQGVDISCTNIITEELSQYDHLLEKLKLEIKKAFRNDWNCCVWIKDEQSESLCSHLYPRIFRAENRLRAFANKVLIWELGTNWIESAGLEKYAESHKKLGAEFRSKEPSFADVDDVFISATLETVFEIIKDGVVFETPFALSKEQFCELLKIVSKAPKENVADWLKRKQKVKKNLWTDIFEQYFVSTTNSQQKITDFILNRNHVAHNKPITYSAYQRMSKSFSDFDEMVNLANVQFEESSPSEEYELTVDLLNEQAQQEAEKEEYERNYLRDRIYGETGVEILWLDDIFEMLTEKADLLYQTFHDMFYWDSRFDFSEMHALEDTETWQTLFSVECKANEEYYLELQVEIAIDDEMDGDSSINYRYIIHGLNGEVIYSNNGQASASVRYHNGNGCENVFEGTIELISDSDIDETEIDEFLDELKTAIEEFNPYIAIKESMKIAAVKDGEPQPVADFPCWECEQLGVSLREDLYKFGHCCYCGTDNEVQICEVCSTPFGDGDGSEGICNNCLAKIEKE